MLDSKYFVLDIESQASNLLFDSSGGQKMCQNGLKHPFFVGFNLSELKLGIDNDEIP